MLNTLHICDVTRQQYHKHSTVNHSKHSVLDCGTDHCRKKNEGPHNKAIPFLCHQQQQQSIWEPSVPKHMLRTIRSWDWLSQTRSRRWMLVLQAKKFHCSSLDVFELWNQENGFFCWANQLQIQLLLFFKNKFLIHFIKWQKMYSREFLPNDELKVQYKCNIRLQFYSKFWVILAKWHNEK